VGNLVRIINVLVSLEDPLDLDFSTLTTVSNITPLSY